MAGHIGSSAEKATEDILDLVRSTNSLPVGFIGSGFSRRYMATPDWRSLLEYLAGLTGRPINQYFVNRTADPSVLYPKAASQIATAFSEVWWNNPKYAEQRDQYASDVHDISDPIKLQASLYIGQHSVVSDIGLQAELEAFSKARFQSFVTTNYDCLIEGQHSDFSCYESQSDALFSPIYEMGEIYKVHGSVKNFSSMVLTSEDYSDYERRNPYLIAKMMTLFVENPVLFFGYSVSDSHIQNMLNQLRTCLTEDQLKTLNDRMIFIGRPSRERPEELRRGSVVINGHTFYIQEAGLEDWAGLFSGLSELPYHFAPRVLRRLRESIYLAARNPEYSQKVKVVDIDDDTEIEKLEIVLGVGIIKELSERGYGGLPFREYLIHMLEGKTTLNPNSLRQFTFVSYRNDYVPMHYFDWLSESCDSDPVDTSSKKMDRWREKQRTMKPHHSTALQHADLTYRELSSSDIPYYLKNQVPLVLNNWEIDDVVALRDWLLSALSGLTNVSVPTEFAKLACLYDRIVFGGEFKGDQAQLRLNLGLNEG